MKSAQNFLHNIHVQCKYIKLENLQYIKNAILIYD